MYLARSILPNTIFQMGMFVFGEIGVISNIIMFIVFDNAFQNLGVMMSVALISFPIVILKWAFNANGKK